NSPYTAAELLPVSNSRKVDRPLHVLPMGVDTDGLDPVNRTAQARCALAGQVGVSNATRLLLYAGRLAPEKNIPLLVDVMELLPEQYHLVIAGEGSERGWLEEEGQKRTGGRIHLTGHLKDRAAIATLLAGADVFVHPNPQEPFGIGPLEAMAAGVPLVGPSTGGVTFYAGASNAWLAPANGTSYAEAVESVFSNPSEYAERVSAARQTAISHSWPVVAAKFFKLFDDILSGADLHVPQGPAAVS
ncbi:MAG: glycosyltransferase, partial [Bryobacteraceae bacterium]|nr:glycosyltransferase [Bryobacteraceae bacterium]